MILYKDHSAMVVSIAQYPSFEPLPRALEGADAFIAWLRSDGGLNERNIHVVQSVHAADSVETPARPLRHEIDRSFWQLGLGSDLILGTRLYVYFSGLGFRDSQDGLSLLPADAAPDSLANALSISQYLFYLRSSGAFKELVVLADLVSAHPHGPDAFTTSHSAPPPFGKPLRQPRSPNELMVTLLAPAGSGGGLLTQAVLDELTRKEVPELSQASLGSRIREALFQRAGNMDDYRLSTFTSGLPIEFKTKAPQDTARMIVESPHWAAEIEVVKATGEVVRACAPAGGLDGECGLELELAPGVYEVTVTLEGQSQKKLVGLLSGQVHRLPADNWKLSPKSSAPLYGMAQTQEAQAKAAAVQSRVSTWSGPVGGDSRLFIFMRAQAQENLEQAAGLLVLLDWKGDLVTDFSHGCVRDDAQAWWSFNGQLAAGTYVLHRRPAVRVRELYQVIHLAAGWTTQLFMPVDGHPSLRNLSVNMCPAGSGFDPADLSAMANESMVAGMRRGRATELVKSGCIDSLLRARDANPILCLLAAHALRAAPKPTNADISLLGEIRAYLLRTLPHHPDQLALAIEPDPAARPGPVFWLPPMLQAGLALVQRAALQRKDIIPTDSLTDCLLTSHATNSPWTSWRRLERTPLVCEGLGTAPQSALLAQLAPRFVGTASPRERASPSAAPQPVSSVAPAMLPASMHVYRLEPDRAGAAKISLEPPSLLGTGIQDDALLRELTDLLSPIGASQLPSSVFINTAQGDSEPKPAETGGAQADSLEPMRAPEDLQQVVQTYGLRDFDAGVLGNAILGDAKNARVTPALTLESAIGCLLVEAEQLSGRGADNSGAGQTERQNDALDVATRLRNAAASMLNVADLVAITRPDGELAYANGAFMSLIQNSNAPQARKIWKEVFHNAPAGTTSITPPQDALAHAPAELGMFPKGYVLERTAMIDPATQQPCAFLNLVRSNREHSAGVDLPSLEPLLKKLSLFTSIYSHSETPSNYRGEIEGLSQQIENFSKGLQ
jgi:hypothetical protein